MCQNISWTHTDKEALKSWEEQGFKDALNDAEFLSDRQLANVVKECPDMSGQSTPMEIHWESSGFVGKAEHRYHKGWIAGMRAVFHEIQ